MPVILERDWIIADYLISNSGQLGGNIFFEEQEVTSTPEPGTLLGLLAVGSIGALARKRKSKDK